MLPHGFSRCAGSPASRCGACSPSSGCFRTSISLRGIRALGLPAALCRTLVVVTRQQRGSATPAFLGFAFASDAVLLTGLLDITGGPFNPFIVAYAAYVWAAAVIVPPAWAAATGLMSLAGFGWLVVDHLQAELIEHHRLNGLSDSSVHDVVRRCRCRRARRALCRACPRSTRAAV